MNDIKLEKINEVTSKVICNQGILMELDSTFTFQVPGYKWMPKYQSGMWDGKIHLIGIRNSTIPNGLISYIKEFASNNKYQIDIPKSFESENISLDEIRNFGIDLNLHSKNIPIIPRDYQITATHYIASEKRGVIVSSTSSGKSLVLYMIIRWILSKDSNPKILLVVPTTSLVEQMYTDFEDYSSHNGFKIEQHCHRIYSGKEKITDKNIIISTWQSLINFKPEWFKQFHGVIIDEVHGCTAKSLQTITNRLINASWRIGSTGSLQDAKAHSLAIESVLGKAKTFIKMKDLMDRKEAAQTSIKALELQYDAITCKKFQSMKYADEIKYLITNPKRNKFITNLVLKTTKETGNTLVLIDRIEHGETLFDMIQKKSGRKNIYLVNGDVDTEIREDIRAIVEKEKDACIIASFGVYQAGISIKNLYNLIFAHPSKSPIRIKQSLGRTGRISSEKDSATVYDIGDNLSHKSKKNHTYKHFISRLSIYYEEKYSVSIHKIPFDNF